MAFPFFPMGAITASLVLGGAIVLFRVLLLALDRGAAELRGSIGPALVRGVRAWAAEHEDSPTGAGSKRGDAPPPGDLQPGSTLEDLTLPPELTLEAVRRRTRPR
jgi:hypothetical protein